MAASSLIIISSHAKYFPVGYKYVSVKLLNVVKPGSRKHKILNHCYYLVPHISLSMDLVNLGDEEVLSH